MFGMQRWMARSDRQAQLMGGMMERAGVDVDTASRDVLGCRMASAIRLCLVCRSADSCAAWQAREQGPARDVPAFCPNATFFRAHKAAAS